jgi:hypothetical protein
MLIAAASRWSGARIEHETGRMTLPQLRGIFAKTALLDRRHAQRIELCSQFGQRDAVLRPLRARH